MKLTKTAIERATYDGDGKSRSILYDDTIPGFGVRLYPTGRKAFVLRYRNLDRRERLVTIGRFPVLSLREAREIAREMLVTVARGGDPAQDRKERRTAATVNELCDTYLEQHAKPHKKTWREDKRRLDLHIRPRWGSRTVRSIEPADVATLHHAIAERGPYEANRTLQLVRFMFKVAPTLGAVPRGWENPAVGIRMFRETKRERWVTAEELPRLAEAIDAESNVYIRAVFWLYLLTGARKRELLDARWSDVDLERRELRLPETKAGRSHTIPLSEPALEILRNLPKEHGNPYLFPGRVKGRPIRNVHYPWQKVRERAGLQDVRLHDLRRTVGSWMAQSGNTLLLIQKALNHTSTSATLVYARLANEPLRRAFDDHGEQIERIRRGERGAEVVPLARGGS